MHNKTGKNNANGALCYRQTKRWIKEYAFNARLVIEVDDIAVIIALLFLFTKSYWLLYIGAVRP
ncbi:hypothetical protein D210916BOD24_18240 [Alteromonas sp. D210916BOD_24]|uniref:hypothetical protein n=1 Tax=Alteromonas sp. D210916BOD_24 TaxID=3157618 RepID=UPI00399CD332